MKRTKKNVDTEGWLTFEHQKKKQTKIDEPSVATTKPRWLHQKHLESYFTRIKKTEKSPQETTSGRHCTEPGNSKGETLSCDTIPQEDLEPVSKKNESSNKKNDSQLDFKSSHSNLTSRNEKISKSTHCCDTFQLIYLEPDLKEINSSNPQQMHDFKSILLDSNLSTKNEKTSNLNTFPQQIITHTQPELKEICSSKNEENEKSVSKKEQSFIHYDECYRSVDGILKSYASDDVSQNCNFTLND